MERQFLRPEISWNQMGKKEIDYPEVLASYLKHNSPAANTLTTSSVLEIHRETNDQLRYCQTEIVSIDAQIVALQRRREALVKEATPGWMMLDACETVLAPIRHIPSEVLQEIALNALPAQPHLTPNEAPLSLSRVCRDWRTALFSLPQAWSELYLEIQVSTLRQDRPQVAVKNWFDRAKNHPLSFHLHLNSPQKNIDPFSSSIEVFLNDLSSYFHRLHHLGLSAEMVLDYFRFFRPSRFGNLHTLELNHTIGYFDSEFTEYVMDSLDKSDNMLAFQILPSLRKLCLGEAITFKGPGKRMFPWGQLTDLCLSSCLSPTNWRRLLELCPQLRKGYFNLDTNENPFEQDSSTEDGADHGVLSNIEDLRIFIYDMDVPAKKYFENCRFPHLRVLHLCHGNEFADGEEEWNLNEPNGFPHEFGSIQSLAVEGEWSAYPECLEELLVASSSVTHLALQVELDAASFLRILTHPGHSSDDEWHEEESDGEGSPKERRSILPNLSDLTLVLTGYERDEDEDIPRTLKAMEWMLESRTSERLDPSKRLRRFRVLKSGDLWSEGQSRRIQTCLDRYRFSGLAFEVAGPLRTETPCSCREWYGGIEQRTTARDLFFAEMSARSARVSYGTNPRRPLPGGSFPGF